MVFCVVTSDSQLPKCTKTRLKSHKIAYKTSKHRLQRGASPQTPLGELATLPDLLVGWRDTKNFYDQFTPNVDPLPEKKTILPRNAP